ncbi:carbohydrate kinase [Spirosoma sp. HMF4905]|uniref:Carbohydrate kinase n=1 Tax=Spirosoma arboris TaxID=2682092 RepID=A0A7K1SD69_9BACT|nr:PfkB family carbohydrate kinase [Spirosoma arboris]MVM31516.1 carbohydrate kinase [Spirosoma arboris]
MTSTDIKTVFQRFTSLKVGVIGDFAIDLYFTLQTKTGEISLETDLEVFWGSKPRAFLGAAGNVVQNLVALGVSNIQAIGCVGNDLYGREMQYLFRSLGVQTQYLQVLNSDWDTCLYTKPNQSGKEANRIDFGIANKLDEAVFSDVIIGLEQALGELDVLIINQQFANPLLTENRVTMLNALMARFPKVRFLVDMRDVGKLIQRATLKVNTAELAKFLSIESPEHPDLDWCVRQGNLFREQSGGPLLITRGQAGILYLDDYETQLVEGLSLQGELDTVGAGDTVVATWAACIGAGATPQQALTIANLAAAVTVQKLNQTGTASLSEILALHSIDHSND